MSVLACAKDGAAGGGAPPGLLAPPAKFELATPSKAQAEACPKVAVLEEWCDTHGVPELCELLTAQRFESGAELAMLSVEDIDELLSDGAFGKATKCRLKLAVQGVGAANVTTRDPHGEADNKPPVFRPAGPLGSSRLRRARCSAWSRGLSRTWTRNWRLA